MSEQGQKSRFAIDLDDLERQLRNSPAQDVKQPQADPFAELARLVGQDDPYKDMFWPSAAPDQQRIEPVFAGRASQYAPQYTAHVQPAGQAAVQDDGGPSPYAVPQDDLRGALDEFDAIFDRPVHAAAPAPVVDDVMTYGQTASGVHYAVPEAALQPQRDEVSALDDMISRDLDQVLQENHPASPAPASYGGAAVAAVTAGATYAGITTHQGGQRPNQPEMDASPEAAHDLPPQGRRFGKGAMTAAVLVAIGLGGVGAAALWRGGGKAVGEPPTIKADAGPAKVQPQNPGGTDIPDQNKQIYERGTTPKPADTRVVNREEQPIDVQAAARTAARVVLPGPSSASAPSAPDANAPSGTASMLGEPRKVRTVLIRPDGSIAGPAPANSAPAGGQIAAASPAATTPQSSAQTPAVPSIVRQQAPRPAVRDTAPETTASPAPVAQARPVPPQPVTSAPLAINPPALNPPATPARALPQRVAAAPAAPVPASAPAAEAAPASGNGNFVVQLGAPGSEEEARSTFASLQRRYPDELGGQRPLIRKADVGGREVYRLRVGPLSSSEAGELCNKLKARGGQCFIARN